MFNRERINSLVSLTNAGGICGWLLLVRPLIYLVFSRRRDLNAYSSVDSSAVVFIIYTFVCFYFSMRELQRKDSVFARELITRSPLKWFTFYTLLGMASILWSVNPQLTGFRAFECLSMMMLVIVIVHYLFSNYDFNTIINWSILYVIVDIIFSLIRAVRYTTDISALLQTSQMMATVFFFMALYYTHKRWYHYLIMIMSVFSMSTVAYIGMALGSISTFWSKPKYRTWVFMGALVLASIITIIGPYKFIKDTVFFDKKTISIHETTGRDKVMYVAIDALSDKPEGYGFFAGEPYLLYAKHLGAINGHNSFLSASIGLGYAGILLLLVFFFGMFTAVFSRYIPYEYRATLIGCFLVGFLQCMGNPGIGSRVFGGWLPVMYLFTLICGFYICGKYYIVDESGDDSFR